MFSQRFQVDDLIKPFILGEMVKIGGEAFETTVTFCNAVKKINGKGVSLSFYGGARIYASEDTCSKNWAKAERSFQACS